jgi:hypothetical protein
MVEDALSSPYGIVEFKIDGYGITIMCVVEKPLHYCLAVYVDGKIKVEWISQDLLEVSQINEITLY